MNSKMKNVARKHRKAKKRKAVIAAQSREDARAKTKEKWVKTGLIPSFRT